MSDDYLYSAQFDDVYFSRAGGLDETRHVFLAGNDLPERWQDKPDFTIAETGFGSGLNFLAAWTLFEETAGAEQHLHYISFEQFPLEKAVIANALAPWVDEFGGRLEHYLDLYPVRIAGFHRIVVSPQVTLTLVFDDVNAALPQLVVPRGVDAWFLDGFTPAKNPEMWTDRLFCEMARLSAPGATFATFTAAGFVRRGLAKAGFTVEKRPGFGHKRDMSVGVLAAEKAPLFVPGVRRVAVVGGGLAGTACAYVLRQRGLEPVIFEAADHLGAGASGNRIGMLNPRFYAQRSPEADFYASAFALAGRALKSLPESAGVAACGSLHLMIDADKEKRFGALVSSGQWPDEAAQLVDAARASEIAGVEISYPALWLPGGGIAHPEAVCQAYAEGCDVRFNTPLSSLEQRKDGGWRVNGEVFDAVILACGAAVKGVEQAVWLPVHTVRGQVSWVKETEQTGKLNCNICYGGYITPAQGGLHVVGSTFQKWLEHTDLLREDDEANLEKLRDYVPGLTDGAELIGGRAGLRTAVQDRFPLISRMPDGRVWDEGGEDDFPDLYVSTGHGSHGVVSTILGAQLIADMIMADVWALGRDSVAALSPARFLRRARRKGAKMQESG